MKLEHKCYEILGEFFRIQTKLNNNDSDNEMIITETELHKRIYDKIYDLFRVRFEEYEK